ncbi:TIGR01620 family protein [Marinovum sp. 2_MG-2023]|uniref:YcjF family protein n=1 Tax=unclassified Marinovum TaxID=2647166 RepID=UPI0026E14199|nr:MULTISPECIES: TIGR01620 family protein [unclassified Marinovum]MDO6728834.1 TIGR01620 family protein [Marinovum sp. 2_MG-2023]MDO6777750.1 TIGR01620 family protein [Marinovum sp. 1_MG-2023]
MSRKPVLIELEDDAPSPAEAPPVPELGPPTPQGQAMQTAAVLAARRGSRLARWFWGLLVAVIGAAVSVAAWDFATAMIARQPILGWAITGVIGLLVFVMLLIAIKELAAFGRLRRVDRFRRAADDALADSDLKAARKLAQDLIGFYAGREDTRWGREKLKDGMADSFDAEAMLAEVELDLLAPLDAAARREVEAAARQVATVTAIVPLALADVATALTANLRMIRRIAEIYGGRSGTLGSWRLTRAVMAHLVATGAVAVGDDMLEPLLGGSLLGKLSRRFGEGMVNGALTARVGVATMDVCRPVPFLRSSRPSVRGIIQSALGGLFKSGK